MVFYRKYRPQKIDDLDNKSVREKLISILSNDPPHAFLFTGPKGLGKTSTARIIAKVVNCTGKKRENYIEPCNKCEQCISITEGTNMDILEIDAASNRGIDEIRELKEKIRLSPMGALKKVYIIDEVHMLTTEAFNALLKTLEEPPEHAMFILCTTEPQKVPATIISRCLHIHFSLATKEELVRSFKRIVKNEKIIIDDMALEMIANLSDGGFRDGVKILEEIVSLSSGKKITAGFIEEKYKVASIENKISIILEALSKRDVNMGLKTVSQLVEQGIDIKHFLQQLMEELHRSLLVQAGVGNKTKDNKDSQFTTVEIKILFNLLTNAHSEMKSTVIEQLPLELAIIEWCGLQTDQVSIEASESSQYDIGVSVAALRKQAGNIAKVQAMYGVAKNDSKPVDTEVKHASIDILKVSADGKVTEEWIQLLWNNIISEMKNYNHTIAGVLRGCKLSEFDKKVLKIETPFKFHKERLDDMKTMAELTKVCKLLTGKEVRIEVQLKSK